MRISIRLSACFAVLATACAQTPSAPHSDGGVADAGAPAAGTVEAAFVAAAMGASSIEVDNAVVVAVNSYMGSSGVTGTFYIQDQAPNTVHGVAVYVAGGDLMTFPSIGDIVTVKGTLGTYQGAAQIYGDSSATALSVTTTGSNGMSSGGALPPAGTPTMVSAVGQYAHQIPSAHPELIGNELQFSGPLVVTHHAPMGFITTNADGGTSPQGFEISGGVWVDDSYVYYNCMRHKGPDGGTLYPDLQGGIRGVWDRFQDDGVDGGTAYPVLFPMSCDDLNPLGLDAGTPPPAPDAGTPTPDAGTPTPDAGTPTPDAGTPPPDAGNPMVDAGMPDGGVVMSSATVQDIVMGGPEQYQSVTVTGAVVVAAYSYMATAGGTTGTFWIQDPHGQNGLEVYVANTDMVTFPAVGDVVTVSGYVSVFDDQLQIATSAMPAVTLAVMKTGTGTATAGAYSPAGSPTMVPASSAADYVATGNGHPEQLGTVIQLGGPLTITAQAAPGLVSTKADGGMVPEGFEVTGGVYVYDSNVYYDCLKGKGADGGTLYPPLMTGIRGVWQHFQDGTSGTAYSVITPMSCADLMP